MTDTIFKLYDTFLSRFSFFRAHIKVLLEMNDRIGQLESQVSYLSDQVDILETRNAELLDRCNELEQAPTSNGTKKETSRDLIRTSQDIMQSIYSNYYATGEALPDRQ